MSFTPYTFAVSDFVVVALGLTLAATALCAFTAFVADLFNNPRDCDNFDEPIDDARFEEPTREETGIAAEIAGLPPGSQLVEIDTAGMLTPPGAVMVHEYRWTGSRIEFVRTCPLHEFDFTVPAGSTETGLGIREWPELKAAREAFLN